MHDYRILTMRSSARSERSRLMKSRILWEEMWQMRWDTEILRDAISRHCRAIMKRSTPIRRMEADNFNF